MSTSSYSLLLLKRLYWVRSTSCPASVAAGKPSAGRGANPPDPDPAPSTCMYVIMGMYVCEYVYEYVCEYLCMYVCVSMYVSMYALMYVCMYVCNLRFM